MINFTNSYKAIADSRLHPWLDQFKQAVNDRMADYTHGNLSDWIKLLKQLPDITPDHIELASKVEIGSASQLSETEQQELKQLLMKFHPWRKGPFHLFGQHIDTEWRSDWKWDRLKDQISPLVAMVITAGAWLHKIQSWCSALTHHNYS